MRISEDLRKHAAQAAALVSLGEPEPVAAR
jgi:hypothetical protein